MFWPNSGSRSAEIEMIQSAMRQACRRAEFIFDMASILFSRGSAPLSSVAPGGDGA
jgi:hypothetical protein